MTPNDVDAVPPSVLFWALLGLLAAVCTMAAYIGNKYERDRKDHKEERDMMLQVVKDNTAAMTRLSSVVDNVQQTLHTLIREEQ
jgi:Flp pilus assembly protein TadB